ncbi:DUF3413 domain-containing protein [Rodentibacter pneumotropicus]|uniref:DUF3413 domain-containing protein n=1 Tax=Rodentibacter pneumotropicus TaxID=758 RepID=UPI000988C9BE|nr:DUF3413 domain-containing protein [Rodentibacter pneumotropicus]NBH75463.1 DUF3413 domain-containing protein [Rodentibacter pneumotropicus]OOF63468.1 hypothetical protein BH925_08140 [Rodentibacter pneumotropicus]TGZ99847.1 DUF3413 domain-containing protein [Rodentibacter pneumotropicus]THA05677.1 DUF3413 domain-containing protein [Rodentibacter pneumotropicus]THA12213.1 DUF3413 domain-containing protein [Rodentibacter pneumotropicus]
MIRFKKGMFSGKQYRDETSRKISWGHWFAFFNIIIAILIGARYAFLIDWPDTLGGKLYFFVSLLGHFSFSVFAVYLLVIFPLSFIVKNHRTFRGLMVILSTICITLLLFDTEVFHRFNLHLSSVVWNLLVNPDNGEMSRDWQIFFAPMPIILLVQMLFSRWSWEKLRSLERQKWLKAVGIFFTSAFVATHLIYAWADAYLYRPITMQRANFPLSYPMTARSFLEKHGLLDGEQYAQTLEQEGRLDALKISYPKHPLVFTPMGQKPNILFITVSGLRYDAISAETMPKLAEFAANSTKFTNHYSSGNTKNSGLVGLFYGLNANYTDSILSNHTSSVFIEKLKAEKYQFGLFSVTNFKESLFRQALFRGMKLPKGKSSNESAVKNFNEFIATQKSDNPWFAYLDLDLKINNVSEYGQYLTQMDKLIEQALANVPVENTMIIVTAEHGLTFNTLSKKERENYFGRDQIQVPLFVYWKGLPVGIEKGLTNHTDLLPALMKNVFNVQNPSKDYSQGHNLFERNGDDWVLVSNYRWNVLVQPDGTQYHIDRKGNYKKFDRTYQEQSSERPPLGLFLEMFKRENSFFDK